MRNVVSLKPILDGTGSLPARQHYLVDTPKKRANEQIQPPVRQTSEDPGVNGKQCVAKCTPHMPAPERMNMIEAMSEDATSPMSSGSQKKGATSPLPPLESAMF